eukprot:scaffold37745_cov67-Cyclotella_meneghiniana.AAC.2
MTIVDLDDESIYCCGVESTELNQAFSLLDENQAHRININFYFRGGLLKAYIEMNDKEGIIIHHCYHDGLDHSQCDRLDSDHPIGHKVHNSLEAFYEGVEGNCSVETLDLHIAVFSYGYALPAFDLPNVQFKENLMCFTLREASHMSKSQSLMIASVLETMSLERFNMSMGRSFSFLNDFSYERII